MKNGESSQFEPFCVVHGGNVKNAVKIFVFAVLAILGAGWMLSGCKSAPELTQANAQTLIQAKYDQTPAVGANITVDHLGLSQGITGKLWTLTKVYPNKYWADYTLTADGKKAVKLPGGGDVLQWRPDSADDKGYSLVVVTVAANHLKAHDVKDPQDEVLPGVSAAKGAAFIEGVNLDGVPDAVQQIAHNPGNKLSTKRQADFSLENGTWVLHAIV